MTTLDIRFNNGRGAILCTNCQIIVDSNFTPLHWEALSQVEAQAVPCYCKYCNKEKHGIFMEKYMNEKKKLLKYE